MLFDLPQLNGDSKEGENSQDKLAAEMPYLPIKYNLLRKSHNLFHSPHTWITQSKQENNGYRKMGFFLCFLIPSAPLPLALFLAKYPETIAIVTRFISAHCYSMLWVPDVQVSIHKLRM